MIKSLLTTCILFTVLSTAQAQTAPSKTALRSFKKLSWLEGEWNRTNVKPGQTATESWRTSGNSMLGMGVSMKASDTTFVEKLRVEIKGDDIFYVADVRENATPTYFKITEFTKTGFVSENPTHDFPKVIAYDLKGRVLTVVISDGGDKKMGFVFEKKE